MNPLEILNATRRDFEGDGMASIGASAALRAMAPYWSQYFTEGRQPDIIFARDIDAVIEQLETMSNELMKRLRRMQQAEATTTAGPTNNVERPFSVEVGRMGYRSCKVKVDAQSAMQAASRALANTRDCDFPSEHTYEYEILSVQQHSEVDQLLLAPASTRA